MATLLAHAQTLLRSKTVDPTFDGEQDIDALDRLGRDRRLGEPREIEEVCPASSFTDRTWLAIGLVEPAEASIGVGLHQSRIARQMLLRMLPATIRRIGKTRPLTGLARQTGGRRAHRSRAGPFGLPLARTGTAVSSAWMRSAAKIWPRIVSTRYHQTFGMQSVEVPKLPGVICVQAELSDCVQTVPILPA